MSRNIRNPLNHALEGLETAAQEVATQCWQWDQLARELWEEFEQRYVPGDDNSGWMGYYVERLRRYAPDGKGVRRELKEVRRG